MKASFNPLFVDSTLSITVPIKVRCSPETDAFRNMSCNISGVSRSPEATLGAKPSFEGIGSPVSRLSAASQTVRGLCYHQPHNPGRPEIHLRVLPLLSPGLKGPSAMTLQSHPPYWAKRLEEASRSHHLWEETS